MSRVYISSWSKPLALAAKTSLEDAGHTVISTWHEGEFKRSVDRSEEDMRSAAKRNVDLIVKKADVLFLIVAAELKPGGTYVEAGVSLAFDIPVVAVGHRPDGTRGNNMLYHPLVAQYADMLLAVEGIEDAIETADEYAGDFDDDDGVSVIDASEILVSPDTVLGCGCKAGEPCGYDPANLPVED